MMLSAILANINRNKQLVVIRVHSLPELTSSFLDQHSKEKKVVILIPDGGSGNSLEHSSTINCET